MHIKNIQAKNTAYVAKMKWCRKVNGGKENTKGSRQNKNT